jgi:hypothetical protein
MPRGLHPKTLPQRAGRAGHWSAPLRTADQLEYRDAPMRSLGSGIVGTMIGLLLIVGGVVTFVNAIKPRTPQLAGTAAAHFHTTGPALQIAARADRAAIERAHSAPTDAAIERAMDEVVRRGWDHSYRPPGRADVATRRAEAGQ